MKYSKKDLKSLYGRITGPHGYSYLSVNADVIAKIKESLGLRDLHFYINDGGTMECSNHCANTTRHWWVPFEVAYILLSMQFRPSAIFVIRSKETGVMYSHLDNLKRDYLAIRLAGI